MDATSVKPKNADAKELQRHYKCFFGKKYKDKTVAEVLKEDPGYLLWAHREVAYVKFPQDIVEEAQENLEGGTFQLNTAELDEHNAILHNLAQGLDTYGNNGVRQVHGVSNDVNIHKTLTYFKELSKYVLRLQKKYDLVSL